MTASRIPPGLILTRFGQFNLLDPTCSSNRIDIDEIARALSHICRYNGHTSQFYSVAQHSVFVAQILREDFRTRQHAMAGLLHDAAEALIGDMVKPLKDLIPQYHAIERNVERAVFGRFGLDPELDPCVKRADLVMLRTELRDLMGVTDENAHRQWALPMDVEPLEKAIVPMSSEQARQAFLEMFWSLETFVPSGYREQEFQRMRA